MIKSIVVTDEAWIIMNGHTSCNEVKKLVLGTGRRLMNNKTSVTDWSRGKGKNPYMCVWGVWAPGLGKKKPWKERCLLYSGKRIPGLIKILDSVCDFWWNVDDTRIPRRKILYGGRNNNARFFKFFLRFDKWAGGWDLCRQYLDVASIFYLGNFWAMELIFPKGSELG